MKKKPDDTCQPHEDEVILLEDLAPRKEVKGGAGSRLFGERVDRPEAQDQPPDQKRGSHKG